MDLVEMLSTIWRTKWIIIITALVATGVVFYNSLDNKTTYRADATLVVGSMSPGMSTLGRAGGEDKLAVSYAELIFTRSVLDKAREAGDLDISNAQLMANVGAVEPVAASTSPFVKLYAVAATPEDAIRQVNALSEGLVSYISEEQEQVLKENQETALTQLAGVEEEIRELQSAPVKDQPRIDALEDIRRSLISQYADILSANLPGANLRIVGEAQNATPIATHTYRDTILAFISGTLAGTAIGFAFDSVRNAWRRDDFEAPAEA